MKAAVKMQIGIITGLVVGIIILLAFLNPIKSFANILSSKNECEDIITKGSLNRIAEEANALKDEPKIDILQIRDEACTLVAFSKGVTREIVPPDEYSETSALCLCRGIDLNSCLANYYCKEINADSITFKGFLGNEYYITHEDNFITDLTLQRDGNNLILFKGKAVEEPLQEQKLIPQEEIIASQQVRDNIKLYLSYIEEAHEKYPDVPATLLQALIAQESQGIYYAISYFKDKDGVVKPCGALGLLQLMPGTAKDNGIKHTFLESTNNKCDSEYAANLKEQRDYTLKNYWDEDLKKKKLYELDNRFDPRENLIAAASYLNKLLKDPLVNGDVNLALAAYNGGTCNKETGNGALCQSVKCPGKLAYECELNKDYQQTRDYVSKVVAYKQDFETTAVA
ncbi:MAG: lytic transglycosylase domain-containing protein [Nanoarchaeota archaeon]